MKTLCLLLLLLPFSAGAMAPGESYWTMRSTCKNNVYHFDTRKGTYQMYNRVRIKDKQHGEYVSYQYFEGRMLPRDGAKYKLTGKAVKGWDIIDFSNPAHAVIISSKSVEAPLDQCDPDTARHLIIDAEMHFLACPKNTLNCKSK